jgi:hypothetical protein
MNLNRAKVAFWPYYVVRSFKATIWTVETYVPEFLVVPKSEDSFSALGATIACALSQRRIIDACPFQIQSFMRRIMLNIGKLDPAMFPGPSTLVLRDGDHLPRSYIYN